MYIFHSWRFYFSDSGCSEGAQSEKLNTCCWHSLWAIEMLKQWYFYHQSTFLVIPKSIHCLNIYSTDTIASAKCRTRSSWNKRLSIGSRVTCIFLGMMSALRNNPHRRIRDCFGKVKRLLGLPAHYSVLTHLRINRLLWNFQLCCHRGSETGFCS